MQHYVSLELLAAVIALIILPSHQTVVPRRKDSTWDLGSGFRFANSSDGLWIGHQSQSIWSASLPFLSASAGNDVVIGSSGAFNITNVDIDMCQGQTISSTEAVAWDGTITGSAIRLTGELLDCGSANAPYTATFWVPSSRPDRIAFYVDISSPVTAHVPLKKLHFRFDSGAMEDFYGLGAQASFGTLKGQRIPVFSREQGVGRGDQPVTDYENENGTFAGGNRFTTYTAIPSYISTEGNVFYLSGKSTAYADFDFTDSSLVTIRYDSLSVDGMFLQATDMFDAVSKLTDYTGRMPPLPSWVDNGAILGIQGGQDKVNQIVEQGLSLVCPIAGVWLQDWCGTHSQEGAYINISRLWWNWENDEELYPTWNRFVQDLRTTHNIRTLSYINTFLTNVSTKPTGFRRNLYAEAIPLHYFVQNTTVDSTAIISSGPGLEAGIIDLTNPGLRTWFTDVLRTQVWNANISGFMSDFGEYTPVTNDTALNDMVSDAFFFHNQYPYLWAKFQREVIEELGLQDEALLFHRSASMNANRYMNLFWAGDQNVNWDASDGIKSVVTILGHMGLSGYAHSHSDVGGYTDVLTYAGFNVTRSAELLGRWGELAAVSSSVFRSHEGKSRKYAGCRVQTNSETGNIPQVNAQFYSNTSTYEYYAYNARMFVSLAPYRRYILENESAAKGWPLLRPPVMYHADDTKARQITYESFYLGPSLYVAPVLDPGVLEVDVYFPGASDRKYIHVWTGVQYGGGQKVDVAAPYGKPAVFIVEGTDMPELAQFMDFVRRENDTNLTVD